MQKIGGQKCLSSRSRIYNVLTLEFPVSFEEVQPMLGLTRFQVGIGLGVLVVELFQDVGNYPATRRSVRWIWFVAEVSTVYLLAEGSWKMNLGSWTLCTKSKYFGYFHAKVKPFPTKFPENHLFLE